MAGASALPWGEWRGEMGTGLGAGGSWEQMGRRDRSKNVADLISAFKDFFLRFLGGLLRDQLKKIFFGV